MVNFVHPTPEKSGMLRRRQSRSLHPPECASSLRPRMRSGELTTARLLGWLELHELDARVVGIVNVELPLAVAAHLRLLRLLPSVLDEARLGFLDVHNTQRNMIHNTQRMVVCGR